MSYEDYWNDDTVDIVVNLHEDSDDIELLPNRDDFTTFDNFHGNTRKLFIFCYIVFIVILLSYGIVLLVKTKGYNIIAGIAFVTVGVLMSIIPLFFLFTDRIDIN